MEKKRFHMKFQVHCSNNLLLIHWTWWTWYTRNDFIISSHNLIISVLFNFMLLLIPHWEMNLLFSQRIRVWYFTPDAQTNSQNITPHWKHLDTRLQVLSNDTNYHEIRYVDIHSHHNAVCDSTQTCNDDKLCWVHMWIKL